MAVIDPYAPEETKFRREFLIATTALALVLAAIVVINPGLDLALSHAVRDACADPSGEGAWCASWAITAARRGFMAFFALVSLATLIATARVLVAERRWLGSAQARCGFMIAVLVVGPGVVTNLVLKDNLGRARPRDVIELGGTKAFTPALVPSRECPRNCSFVSGEASSMYATFFALALLVPQYRFTLIVGGIAAGTLAGSVRILQGAHFLSDVVFAGLIMALTVSLLHIAMIGLWREPGRTWAVIAGPFTPVLRRAAAARVR